MILTYTRGKPTLGASVYRRNGGQTIADIQRPSLFCLLFYFLCIVNCLLLNKSLDLLLRKPIIPAQIDRFQATILHHLIDRGLFYFE